MGGQASSFGGWRTTFKRLQASELNLRDHVLKNCDSTWGIGKFFGYHSLLHNTRNLITVRAVTDVEAYALPRDDFRQCFRRPDPRLDEKKQLLDDCPLLHSMFKFQRHEFACNAFGFEKFDPDQPII